MSEAEQKVCRDCGAEATRVAGRRRGTGYWWCWRCEKAIHPVPPTPDKESPDA